MWKFLQIFGRLRGGDSGNKHRGNANVRSIETAELATLIDRAAGKIMIFDLREPAEIDAYPYAIQDALLTINIDLDALIPWIPPKTVVVLYASGNLPAHCDLPNPDSRKLKFLALKDGLHAWREAGLPMEDVAFSYRRLLDDR